MNLTDLDTFVRVAKTSSMTRVAEQLGVPKSTVSRRVARLEQELGVELVRRHARAFSLTDHGRILLTRCGPALDEIGDVERSLTDARRAPSGTLRVTMPTDLGGTILFANVLASFRAPFPEVAVDIEMSTRLVDLIEEGIDVAVRVHRGALPDSTSLMGRAICAVYGRLYASPLYLRDRKPPRSPEDLPKHACVAARGRGMQVSWQLKRGDEKPASYQIRPTVVANDYALVLGATRAGAGIALLPEFLAESYVKTGELVHVLPRYSTAEGTVSLVWPATRQLAPRVRAYIDHVAAELPRAGLLPR